MNITYPNGFIYDQIDLIEVYLKTKYETISFLEIINNTVNNYNSFLFWFIRIYFIIKLLSFLINIYQSNKIFKESPNHYIKKEKQNNFEDIIYLCKYHSKYNPSCTIENTRCMAIRKNGSRCNQKI